MYIYIYIYIYIHINTYIASRRLRERLAAPGVGAELDPFGVATALWALARLLGMGPRGGGFVKWGKFERGNFLLGHRLATRLLGGFD